MSSSETDNENNYDDDDDCNGFNDQPLYEDAPVTLSCFNYIFLLFSIKHNLSEKGKDDLLEFFSIVLPEDNVCPVSVHKLNKLTSPFQVENTHYQLCHLCHCETKKDRCSNDQCVNFGLEDGNNFKFFVMDLKSQLQSIIFGMQIVFLHN